MEHPDLSSQVYIYIIYITPLQNLINWCRFFKRSTSIVVVSGKVGCQEPNEPEAGGSPNGIPPEADWRSPQAGCQVAQVVLV